MSARFVVVSAERVSRADALLAVARTMGDLPAHDDVEVVTNAPGAPGVLYVFDRERIEEGIGLDA